jgi:hypothetical protein
MSGSSNWCALDDEGVTTWGALHEWLATPVDSAKRPRRVWPMPREARLALPDSPGVYRMLRTSGDVLYVGKASSLHHRPPFPILTRPCKAVADRHSVRRQVAHETQRAGEPTEVPGECR